jgi:hypothetical protein
LKGLNCRGTIQISDYSIPELKKMPIAAARRIIRKAVFKVKGNLHGVGFRHMDAVLKLINSDNKNQFDFPGLVRIKRENDRLLIVRRIITMAESKQTSQITTRFSNHCLNTK